MTPLLKRTRLYQRLKHWRSLLFRPAYRAANRKTRAEFVRFRSQRGGRGLWTRLVPGRPAGTALIVSQYYLPFTPLEVTLAKAMHLAGYRTAVLGNRRHDFLRYYWLGKSGPVHEFSDFSDRDDSAWVDGQVTSLRTLPEWLALEYRGAHVGRFTVASTLRHLRVAKLDFEDPVVQRELRRILGASIRFAVGGALALDTIRPDLVLVMDRGYSGYGEVFDLSLARGLDTVTWSMGYKSNRLALKRYHAGNERDHPLAPSDDSWRRMRDLPWKPEYGQAVRQELFECYRSQDWFSVVGTQFDKKILTRQKTWEKLGLSGERKVAVVFPHILWDGSFFYGEDLFEDYTEWLVETLRAAAANPRLDWVVKLHPAHLVKAKQVRDRARPAELDVIEFRIGPLPPHVRLVHPDTDISTYSLFEIADYVVTVRGTVGIEAAAFGIPVVTAGTGRYDRRGFTLDSSSREEYLGRLASLETVPRLTPAQLELAERYAFHVLFCRPVRLSSISLEFERDEIATPRITVHCRSRQEWSRSPDMRQLADWFADGKSEDMWTGPE
ncbi:MAG TPA: hypothetical protein VI383_03955 [Gemmatimonadales bacterium]|nr:hypothetical protein [Gemmatimonadales bacterium]